MPVQLTNRQRRFPVNPRRITAWGRASLRQLGLDGAELSILLVNDRTMRGFNHAYRGVNRTTDVLSFPLCSGPFREIKRQVRQTSSDRIPLALGDVIISMERAHRQARQHGVTPAQELTLLLVHGVLHLVGYDHERGEREQREMRRMERRLLAGLGMTQAGLVERGAR